MSWGIGDRVGVAVGIGSISTFLSKSINSRGPQPSLTLNFINTSTLDSRITFTRSTTGTYVNSSGVLTTAAINAPRFDFNPTTGESLGLLIEQSSTNLLTYSQNFSNAVWTKPNATITTGAIVAPDGTQTAQLLVENTSTTSHGFYSTVFNIQTSGQLYTQSIYVKSKERTWILLEPSYTTTTPTTTAYFNIGTGAIGTLTNCTATITSVGNGWYRCTATYTATVTRSNIIGGVYLATGDGGVIYTGNGYSGLYVWQNQFENLAFATSPIATTTAQVTRASDNATMTGTNFSSWYNQGQGTIYCESWFLSPVSGYPSPYSINDGTTNNRIQSYANNSLTSLGGDVTLGNVNQANVTVTVPSMNSYIKHALAFQPKVVNFSGAGVIGTTNTTANIPNGLNKLNIGTNAVNGAFSSYTKKLTYYPQALTATQLQALTGS